MSTKEAKKQPKKRMHPDLVRFIRDFVLYHVGRRGRQRTAEALGISRQTLWRYLEYDHDGSAVPSAVMRTVGGSIKGLEGEVIAGDARVLVWQQCGSGLGNSPPVGIVPDASLPGIVDWTQRLAEAYPVPSDRSPRPNPDALYRSRLRASMPEPSRQLE